MAASGGVCSGPCELSQADRTSAEMTATGTARLTARRVWPVRIETSVCLKVDRLRVGMHQSLNVILMGVVWPSA
jgi:hypothetical protein